MSSLEIAYMYPAEHMKVVVPEADVKGMIK